MTRDNRILLTHNLDPRQFVFLWAKYATGVNDNHHCTNSIRGKYSQVFSKHNPGLIRQTTLIMDEQPLDSFSAIYLCGVSAKGYRQKANYPHNLHAAILPCGGVEDHFTFEDWELRVSGGRFMKIPSEHEMPEKYQSWPDEFTTCRIFRWAVYSREKGLLM